MSDDLQEEFEESAGGMPEFQPTNAPAKNILIIDDKMDILWNMLEEDLSEHVEVQFDMVHTIGSAIHMIEGNGIPDVIMLDAYNLIDSYFGYHNACKIIEWFKENHPDKPLPDLVFSSGELDMSEDNAARLFQTHNVVAGVTCKAEFSRIEWGLEGRNPSSLSYSHTGTAIRQVLNTRMGLALPLTDDGLKQHFFNKMKESGDFTMEMLDDMVDAGDMTAAEALQKAKPETVMRVDNYLQSMREPPVRFGATPVDGFMEATGRWSSGPAALSLQEADEFIAKGEKPILVVDKLTPELYPYLAKVAGVIIKSPELSGHTAIELGAWGISSLIGAPEEFHAGLRSGEPLSLDTRFLGVYKAPIDQNKLNDFRYQQGNPFYNSSEAYYISRWQMHFMEERNIQRAKKVYTIDSIEQADDINFNTYGVGLVRSESLVKESTESLAAFKALVLGTDAEAVTLATEIQTSVYTMLKELRGDGQALRYRLLDMPPSEVFSAEELSQIERQYGDKNIRGAQMGLAIPALYESQVRAVFDAVKQAQTKNAATKAEYPDASGMSMASEKIEILVPTIRSADELQQIKIMVATIAAEYGFTEKDYGFGAMIENTDACNDIEAIATICDFISFGTNDLTESVLGVKRDDMEGRMKAAQQLRQPKEPYQMLYPQVLEQMHETINRARNVNPDLKVGVCGSGSADVKSFVALHDLNVDSISMQPSEDNFTILPLLAAFEMVERHEKRQQTLETSPPVNNIP